MRIFEIAKNTIAKHFNGCVANVIDDAILVFVYQSPGYTRKEKEDWYYSQACMEVVDKYLTTYPTLCQYLHKNLNKDKILAENAFPENT